MRGRLKFVIESFRIGQDIHLPYYKKDGEGIDMAGIIFTIEVDDKGTVKIKQFSDETKKVL